MAIHAEPQNMFVKDEYVPRAEIASRLAAAILIANSNGAKIDHRQAVTVYLEVLSQLGASELSYQS